MSGRSSRNGSKLAAAPQGAVPFLMYFKKWNYKNRKNTSCELAPAQFDNVKVMSAGGCWKKESTQHKMNKMKATASSELGVCRFVFMVVGGFSEKMEVFPQRCLFKQN